MESPQIIESPQNPTPTGVAFD